MWFPRAAFSLRNAASQVLVIVPAVGAHALVAASNGYFSSRLGWDDGLPSPSTTWVALIHFVVRSLHPSSYQLQTITQ